MRLLAILTVLLTCTFVIAKPSRPEPAKPLPKADAVPHLAGASNWGEVTQSGRTLQINGHSSWFAVGEVRKDNTVMLVWTLNDGSRSGIGVYNVVNGHDLEGHWGWGDTVYLNEKGELCGEWLMRDTTYKIKPMEPEPDFK